MLKWAVVSADLNDIYEVRLFETFDQAHVWAVENPSYITEVVEVEAMG